MLDQLAHPSGTVVSRARVEARAATRQRMELLCGRVAFRAPGLRPAAILIVRAVRCRVMERDLDALESRMVAGVERGVQAALGAAARDAARPARGDPAENAGAVRFEDLAELVECLARDWLSGRICARWWWRPVLKGLPAERVVHEFCREHPQLVPAIIERLAETSHAARFAASFGPAGAVALARDIARAFGVPDDLPDLVEAAIATDCVPAHLSPSQSRLREAYTACAPPGLAKPAAALLALALALRRVPALALGRGSPSALARACAAPEPSPPDPAPDRSTHVGIDHAPLRGAANDDRPEPRGTRFAFTREESPPPRGPDHPGRAAVDESATSSPRPSVESANRASAPRSLDRVPFEASVVDDPFGAANPTRAADVVGVEIAPRWVECRTAFGGVFYILNAALHMGLYADFTQPRKRGLATSPWDFLAVCGRMWLGKRFVADPVWRLLARLAGRAADEEPGEDFDHECLPRVLERIALALGERRPRRAIARLVLADARVIDTGTHLDVHLALDRLALSVRYAGLDRDPGWIPAAGRIVAFHFD